MAKMAEFDPNRVENSVGKGENAGYQYQLSAFSPFPTMFSTGSPFPPWLNL